MKGLLSRFRCVPTRCDLSAAFGVLSEKSHHLRHVGTELALNHALGHKHSAIYISGVSHSSVTSTVNRLESPPAVHFFEAAADALPFQTLFIGLFQFNYVFIGANQSARCNHMLHQLGAAVVFDDLTLFHHRKSAMRIVVISKNVPNFVRFGFNQSVAHTERFAVVNFFDDSVRSFGLLTRFTGLCHHNRLQSGKRNYGESSQYTRICRRFDPSDASTQWMPSFL